jgi:L-arabinokinase
MKVESETTDVHPPACPGGSATIGKATVEHPSSPLVPEVLEHVVDRSPTCVVCAPGRLDVMGGLSAYAGSLALSMPIADHVCVAAHARTDGQLAIRLTRSLDAGGSAPTVIPMSKLHAAGGDLIDAAQGRTLVPEANPEVYACIVGALVEMLRAKLVPESDGGVSVTAGSTLHDLTGVGRAAALSAATMTALAALHDVTLDPAGAAAACQRVENEWLKAPVGFGGALCPLTGEPNTLMEVRCEARAVGRAIRMPDDLTLLGIHCGTSRAEARIKYARVRTAAFMGKALVDRIVRHDGAGGLRWNGYLSQIPVPDYVERFRDRLPTKLKGCEYLERFGETGDPLTRVEPAFTYRIRSRTEHHIYEHARACQFVQCLQRAIRNADNGALVEAGELMYASHWSYGQRCGLGSVETDLLVNAIREHGARVGVYGAKITGGGCGGVVAVLMRATKEADAAINGALEQYQAKSGRQARLIRGSSPGALVRGVLRT